MIYLVKVFPTEYEEIDKLIIVADNCEKAIEIAKKEVSTADESLGINRKKFYEVNTVEANKNTVLMSEVKW